MKKAALSVTAAVLVWSGAASQAFPAAFQKVSDHFYYLESSLASGNTCAVVTADGVILIDPPPEAELASALDALKSVTARPVRWVVNTDYHHILNGGSDAFPAQGIALIGSDELDRLAYHASGTAPLPDFYLMPKPPSPRFLFGSQLRLFPEGIEVRLLAVNHKARTAGDVVVILPSEKVVAVGDLFTPWSYPVIDSEPGEGTATGWIDGLKQVIDAVPLLKSAMPQPKPEVEVPPEPEKTLEELVVVIPGHGTPANLKDMKDLLAVAQKLRTEAGRAVRSGRMKEVFLKSLSYEAFGQYGNLESFAGQLFDDLSKNSATFRYPANDFRDTLAMDRVADTRSYMPDLLPSSCTITRRPSSR
jgi:cyclase